jgi:D-alanyl-D-alanine carboxypeptidase
MARRQGLLALLGPFICAIFLVFTPFLAQSAPYAAMVMDARTGEVIHARNADTRLHPASLTKMMTLYIAFQAIERGEIGLDSEVTVTAQAANEAPSRLGLRAGQKIRLRYLLRAAAVRSANDAATAIGIAISGSEEAFAERMNRTAAAMGMTNTTFRNAHGLTQSGHMSTARDMTVLGRHVIYDFPQYYNLFSRRSADAGIATVQHTNRRWLDSYPGGDGIKTGYTNAAGFTLVASAQRGQQRIIATVFGGTSTAARNARITELMDMGFARAPARANVIPPTMLGTTPDAAADLLASAVPSQAIEQTVAAADAVRGSAGRTIRVNGQVVRSYRPQQRPSRDALVAELPAIDQDVINAALAAAMAPQAVPEPAPQIAALGAEPALRPVARPVVTQDPSPALAAVVVPEDAPESARANAPVQTAQLAEPATNISEPEVVTRISTSGGRHWGINVGRYPSRFDAERSLLQVALNEMNTLDGALRRVVQRSGGFDANFMGLTRESADLACRRLQARGTTCFMIGTEG